MGTVWLGLAVQAAAVVGIALQVAHDSARESALGEVTKYSVRLAWIDAVHRPSFGLGLLAAVLVYVAGAVLVALPYCPNRRLLLVGVPVAALLSLAILGVVALVLWALAALAEGGGFDWIPPDVGFDVGGSRRRDRRGPRADTPTPVAEDSEPVRG